MMVEIIHPVTEGRAVVEEVSLPHYYRAGWMLSSDWDARQEAQAARKTASPPAPSSPPSSKPSTSKGN